MDSPQLIAAKKELLAIYLETGGTFDPIRNPNRTPEYLSAQRVFLAVLDAEREVQCQRSDVKHGKKKLEIVK